MGILVARLHPRLNVITDGDPDTLQRLHANMIRNGFVEASHAGSEGASDEGDGGGGGGGGGGGVGGGGSGGGRSGGGDVDEGGTSADANANATNVTSTCRRFDLPAVTSDPSTNSSDSVHSSAYVVRLWWGDAEEEDRMLSLLPTDSGLGSGSGSGSGSASASASPSATESGSGSGAGPEPPGALPIWLLLRLLLPRVLSRTLHSLVQLW